MAGLFLLPRALDDQLPPERRSIKKRYLAGFVIKMKVFHSNL